MGKLNRFLRHSCMSRNGGTGDGGWVHPKGAKCMAMPGLSCGKALVGTGRAISVVFGRNEMSHLVGPPFPAFKAHFSATAGWHFSRALIKSLLIGDRVTYVFRTAEIPTHP